MGRKAQNNRRNILELVIIAGEEGICQSGTIDSQILDDLRQKRKEATV
jgi:hypothetical protein